MTIIAATARSLRSNFDSISGEEDLESATQHQPIPAGSFIRQHPKELARVVCVVS
jgi:hypothetical protein